MATAKLRDEVVQVVRSAGVSLELSYEEANFLRDLLHRHCVGAGFYDPGYHRIGYAIEGVLPPEYVKLLTSNGSVVQFSSEKDHVGNTAS